MMNICYNQHFPVFNKILFAILMIEPTSSLFGKLWWKCVWQKKNTFESQLKITKNQFWLIGKDRKIACVPVMVSSHVVSHCYVVLVPLHFESCCKYSLTMYIYKWTVTMFTLYLRNESHGLCHYWCMNAVGRVKHVESEGHHMCFYQTSWVNPPIMTSTMIFLSYIFTLISFWDYWCKAVLGVKLWNVKLDKSSLLLLASGMFSHLSQMTYQKYYYMIHRGILKKLCSTGYEWLKEQINLSYDMLLECKYTYLSLMTHDVYYLSVRISCLIIKCCWCCHDECWRTSCMIWYPLVHMNVDV